MSREAWKRFRPRVLPAGWLVESAYGDGHGARFVSSEGLCVVASVHEEADGRLWAHVSVSRADRLPSWEDLKWIKDLFIGRHRPAYQVLPRAEAFVSIHPFCLHLWTPVDDGPDPLPQFEADARRGGQI